MCDKRFRSMPISISMAEKTTTFLTFPREIEETQVMLFPFSTNKMCHTKQINKGLQGKLGNFLSPLLNPLVHKGTLNL